MTIPANSWIQDLMVYEPGRPIEELARELGLDSADDIIKLASNENSLGPSPKAVQAMKDAAGGMHVYPDGGAFYLRRAIAEKLSVAPDQLIMGSGSNEIIAFLGHVFLGPDSQIVMSERAFIVYKLIASAYQAETIMVPMKDGFTHDLQAMADAITAKTRLVFISNPNNPTGTMVSEQELDAFFARVPDDVVVVLDEAYIELINPDNAPDTLKYINRPNTILLRTFSKAYGLAGLRIGYGIASREFIQLLHRVRQPFNVNAMAQAAALAALQDDDYVAATRKLVADGLEYLTQALSALGFETVPSVANFVLVKVGAGRQVFELLQSRRIIVRPMDGYKLPEYVRVTVGTQKENEAFVRELTALKNEGRLHI